jgi:hypothetical protein
MIYTDKLPDSCKECPCCKNQFCNLLDDYDKGDCSGENWVKSRRLPNCPMILIEQWRLESCKTCGIKESPYPWDCKPYSDSIVWDEEGAVHVCSGWQPKDKEAK